MTTQQRKNRRGVFALGITAGILGLTLGGIGIASAQATDGGLLSTVTGWGTTVDLEGNPVPESELQTELGELVDSGEASVDDTPAGETSIPVEVAE